MSNLSTSAAFSVPANETERLEVIRSLMPSHITTTPELDALTELVRDVFGTASAAVTIIDDDWQRVAATAGIKATSCSREQSVCNHVVFTGQPFVVPDFRDDERFSAMPYVTDNPGFRFYAGAPMNLQSGITVGALCLIDTVPRTFSSQQMDQLKKFTVIATGLLQLQKANICLRNDEALLKHAALTDPLTGFYNRSALPEIVDRIMDQSLQRGEEVGLLLLDLDRFKSINDVHGHGAGDDLLQQAAARIRSAIREGDIPVRVGGDEFAIFLTSPLNSNLLKSTAEGLLDAFRLPFDVADRQLTVPLSIGVTLAPRDGLSRAELEHHVDLALYSAKAHGRNRYVMFDKSMI